MDLREKMLDMLESVRVEENHEIAGNILIAVSLAVIRKANVYLWAEKDLHLYVRLFKSWGLNVRRVVCFTPKNLNKVDDVEIISTADLFNDRTPNKFIFIDAAGYDMPADFWQEQLNFLKPDGAYILKPVDRANLTANVEIYGSDKLFYYQSHKEELMNLFDSLADETSKRALYYYVESFVNNRPYRGEQNQTRLKYFFGGKYERLYKHLNDECWINCGASIGDTIFAYLSFDFKPKKIYAFEADKNFFNVLLNNLNLLPLAKRELVEPINQFIDDKTDFEKILAGNKLTLLNADIEGAELNLLYAMKNIIQVDRPVVAVCVYHYKEDILNVTKFLQSVCKDYFYYLRKYTPYLGYLKKNGELVFYAVPIERSLIIPPVNLTILIVDLMARDKEISNDIIAAKKFAA